MHKVGNNRKGIILAGGKGTRLYPITKSISKHLLPVYDKPMVFYPLTTLMLAGIKDILIISTSHDLPRYQDLLGNGSKWGVRLTYAKQDEAKGIAEAFIIGEEFIGDSDVALILGDNMFYGNSLAEILLAANNTTSCSTIFAYKVNDPKRYGVVEFDQCGKVISIEEKPAEPKSTYAIPGLYFYKNDVIAKAKNLKPSMRGELEITDINREYCADAALNVITMRRGICWFDAGTHESLLDASNYIRIIEERQGMKVGCPEEIAFRMNLIDLNQLKQLSMGYPMGNPYRTYLEAITEELW